MFDDVDADNDRYRDPQDEDEPTWDEFDLDADGDDEPPERRRGITTVLIFAMLLLTALPIANSRASSFGDWFWSHVPGEPSAQPSGLTWCPGVSSVDKKRIDLGAEQMRRTTESETLLDNLVDRHICVGAEDLVYNGGYTLTSDDANGEEVRRMVLGRAVVRSLSATNWPRRWCTRRNTPPGYTPGATAGKSDLHVSEERRRGRGGRGCSCRRSAILDRDTRFEREAIEYPVQRSGRNRLSQRSDCRLSGRPRRLSSLCHQDSQRSARGAGHTVRIAGANVAVSAGPPWTRGSRSDAPGKIAWPPWTWRNLEVLRSLEPFCRLRRPGLNPRSTGTNLAEASSCGLRGPADSYETGQLTLAKSPFPAWGVRARAAAVDQHGFGQRTARYRRTPCRRLPRDAAPVAGLAVQRDGR